MKLENTFSIPVPVEDAWPVLLDLERIAPCVPGATLTGADGDGYGGKIKVKLGPVGLSYTGKIAIVSRDESARVAVLEGGGREVRGNGTAKATITCRLVESASGTEVFVDTELNITGKPAQFGRGALAEVAGTLIGQFAANLAELITASAPPASTTGRTDSTVRSLTPDPVGPPPRPPAEPIDLLAAAGFGGSKRYGPVLAAVALVAIVVLVRRGRPRASQVGDAIHHIRK